MNAKTQKEICEATRDTLYAAVGREIKLRRTAMGITQEFLAERIDKSTVHMRFLERGLRQAPLHVYVDIAKVLHCTVGELLGDTEDTTGTVLMEAQKVICSFNHEQQQIALEILRLVAQFVNHTD